jgi:hypothetical protein
VSASCCDDFRCDNCPVWVRRAAPDASPALVEIGRLAVEHDASRVTRAAARRELSKQRREWLEGGGEYWGPKDRGDDDEAIFAAHNAREAANASFRRTAGALHRAIRRLGLNGSDSRG